MSEFNPWVKYADNLTVDRTGLPSAKRDWLGDRVCVRYMLRRGHYRQRTAMRYAFGTLVPSTEDHLVTVRESDDKVVPINYKRVQRVWNLSRKTQP